MGCGVRMRAGGLAAVLIISAVRVAGAAVTFHCSFEGTVEPEIHAGDGTPVLEGEAEYAEGVRGSGLVVGDGKAQLQYAVPGNYDLRESTVSYWVKPLNWDGADEKFHVFFQCSGSFEGGSGQGSRLLYKYLVPGRFLMLAIPDEPIPYVNYQGAAYADIASWRPDEWHHVVGCWRGSGLTLYFDGNPIGGRVYYPMPMQMGDVFHFGDRPWHVERDAQTVVDELTIYDRILNAAEVELLYRRPTSDGLAIALRPFFLSGHAEVNLDTSRLPPGEATVKLVAEGKTAVVTQAKTRVPDGADIVAVKLPLRKATPGRYRAIATAGGSRAAADLRVPDSPPWLDAHVGISDTVPPPWTDMREDGGTVACWNRSYEMRPGPFPQQIVSAGAPLLAGPVDLKVTADGEALRWADRGLTITSRQPTQVAFKGEASAGKLRLEVRGRVEFDGMCWLDIELRGAPGSYADLVSLEVPLRGDVARFYQGVAAGRTEKQAGEVGQTDGGILEDSFRPVLWVGNDDRGLQWFTETSQPWDDPARPGSVQLVREGAVVTLRVAPVRSRLDLGTPWRFSFGLQASPIRPVLPEWRRGRLSGVPGTVHMIWTNSEDMIWFGYPRARDPGALRDRVAGLHERDVRVIPYSTPFLLSIESPESGLYGHEWLRVGEGDSGSADVVRMGGCAQYVPPGAPHYADFTTWAHQQFVEEVGFDGLYFDGAGLSPFDLEQAGCGYRRDGLLVPTYPILAKREIMKRMYVMLKARPTPGFLMIHCSGQAVLPFMGFADIRAMGEDLAMRLAKVPSYHEILTEAEWRAIQSGHPYGFSNVLLPMLKGHEDEPVPMQQLMGLVLLYGMDIWPGYGHRPSQGAMRQACDRFGIVGAQYIPFWQDGALVRALTDGVRVSLYRQPDRVMVVMVNGSDEPAETALAVDHDALGLPVDAPWSDLLQEQPLDPGGSIEIGPGNYGLVQIGP